MCDALVSGEGSCEASSAQKGVKCSGSVALSSPAAPPVNVLSADGGNVASVGDAVVKGGVGAAVASAVNPILGVAVGLKDLFTRSTQKTLTLLPAHETLGFSKLAFSDEWVSATASSFDEMSKVWEGVLRRARKRMAGRAVGDKIDVPEEMLRGDRGSAFYAITAPVGDGVLYRLIVHYIPETREYEFGFRLAVVEFKLADRMVIITNSKTTLAGASSRQHIEYIPSPMQKEHMDMLRDMFLSTGADSLLRINDVSSSRQSAAVQRK